MTVSELLTQIRHYNHNVRKEALLGLCEILQKFGDQIIQTYLGNIIQNVVELMTDEDKIVRETLRKVFEQLFSIETLDEVSLFRFYL